LRRYSGKEIPVAWGERPGLYLDLSSHPHKACQRGEDAGVEGGVVQ